MSEERERGMFAPEDRDYLRGEKQYATDQGEYSRRATIRERLSNGIVDFTLAQPNLTEWNWRKFLDLEREEEADLRRGMVCAMALFYEIHHAKGWDFETSLRDAVEHAHLAGAAKRTMPRHTVDRVRFEAKTRRPEHNREIHERIEEKIEQGERLTDREKAVALEMGGPLQERVSDHIEKMRKKEQEEDALRRINEKIDRHGLPETDEK